MWFFRVKQLGNLRRSVTAQIIASSLLASSVFATIATLVDLGLEFDSGTKELEGELLNTKNFFLPIIGEALWTLRLSDLDRQLQSLLSFPNFSYVKLVGDDGYVVEKGNREEGNLQVSEFDVTFEHNGKLLNIAKLHLGVNFDTLYGKLQSRVWFVFFSSMIKSFVVATLLFAVYDRLVTRHIVRVGQFLRSQGRALQGKSRFGQPVSSSEGVQDDEFRLNRSPAFQDEISEMAKSINEFRRKIRAAEEELRRSEKQAWASSEAKSRFLGVISHELNTPLNGILGTAESLLLDEKDAQKRESLQAIRSCGEEMADLVASILDHTALLSGGLRLQSDEIEMQPLVEKVLARKREAAKKRNNSLSCLWEGEETLPVVVGDRRRIMMVFEKLLSNAIAGTEKGSIELKIQTHAEKRDNGLREVWCFDCGLKDTGVGISAEDLDRIGRSFEQVDSSMSRVSGGLGIGLSLCRQILDQMGGQLSLKSALGQGTTVSFSFDLMCRPEREGSEDADQSVEWVSGEAPDQALRSSATHKTLRALVVDDHEFNRMVLSTLLQKLDIPSVQASSGAEALQVLTQLDLDIVFMDCHMPEMDGVETTRLIRTEQNSAIPIVGVTADTGEAVRVRSMAAGMTEFMTKPVRLVELSTKISKCFTAQQERGRRGGLEAPEM